MPEDLRKQWYEQVLRPSVLALQPEQSPEFAASYAQQYANQRRPNGSFRNVTRMVSQYRLGQLVRAMVDNINEHDMEWAMGFFFGHSIRGVKSITKHLGPGNLTTPAEALDDFLGQYFTLPLPDDIHSQLYIDVGVELFMHRECLFGRRQGHAALLSQLAPMLDAQHVAEMVTLGAPKYYQDVTGLLRDVCGFRLAPSIGDAIESGIFYVQCYSTEKNIADSGILNHNTLSLPLADGFKRTKHAINTLDNMFDRMHSAQAGRVESCARLEVRTPLNGALNVLADLQHEMMLASIFHICARDWWYVHYIF